MSQLFTRNPPPENTQTNKTNNNPTPKTLPKNNKFSAPQQKNSSNITTTKSTISYSITMVT